jgi:glucose/arabinose dehydrogenase
MLKKGPRLCALAAWLIVSAVVAVPSGRAHPPWNPYDDTVFAPITRFGPRIRVDTLVKEAPAEAPSEGGEGGAETSPGDLEPPAVVNLTAPLKGVAAPGLPNHLFLVDQPGRIVALHLITRAKTVFLDVSTLLVPLGVFFGPDCPPDQPQEGPSFDERGLLGLAFHPEFAANGKFYTYTSEPVNGAPTFPTTLPPGTPPDHQNVISEWTAADPADPTDGVTGDRRVLLRVDWPQFNHDGGDLAFGPDGLLYIAMGDGGGADDQDGQLFIIPGTCGAEAPMVGHGPEGNGQRLTTPLGKILRIDVDGKNAASGRYGIPADNPFVGAERGVVEEIFALGFRNPYRFSFDRGTGQLFAGDVGQNDLEEVDLVVKGGNYGWRHKEGALCFDPNGVEADSGVATPNCPADLPPDLIDPIAQYDTHHEGHSAVGGFVYRGSQLPELRGRYIFGDFARVFKFPSGPHDYGRLFHIQGHPPGDDHDGGLRRIREFHIQGGNAISLAVLGFGQDAAGEIYVLGNVSGIPFGTQGVVVRLAPPDD